MKTLDEKIQVCKCCKNRKFDIQQGIVCELTGAKPTFEDECEKYEVDEEAVASQARQRAQQEEIGERGVYDSEGWLSSFLFGGLYGVTAHYIVKKKGLLVAFLWLGLGVGTVAYVLHTISSGIFSFGPTLSLLGAMRLVPLVLVAILAIVAFYRHSSNAVALAKTYLSMILVDALAMFVYFVICSDSAYLMFIIISLLGCSGCFIYLSNSESVKAVIPLATRKWKLLEKILLAIYVMATVVGAYYYISFNKGDMPKGETSIQLIVDVQSKQCPIDYGATILTSLTKEERQIIYTYKIKDVYECDIPVGSLEAETAASKTTILNELTATPDPFVTNCLEQGYDIVFRYNDANSVHLYDVVITPEDWREIK